MGKFALGCLTAFLLMGLLVGGFAMFAYSTFNDQMLELISKNPVVVEHLGTVEDVEFDFTPSKEDQSSHPGKMIIQVTGSKATGVLYVTPGGDKKNPNSWSGELKLESGETFPVVFEIEAPDEAGNETPAGKTPDATTPAGTTPPKEGTPDTGKTPAESATPSGTTPTEKKADPAPDDKKEPAGAPK